MSTSSPEQIRDLLVRAAGAAHDAILVSLGAGGSEPLGRGAGGDVTYTVDRRAEDAVYEVLRSSRTGFTILFEEQGFVEVNGGGLWLAVDALDGSRNAVRGFGPYATSLAASSSDRFEALSVGVVMEHTSGRIFQAIRGTGAFENGNLLRIVKHRGLTECIIGVDLCGVREALVARLSPLVARAEAVRHLGANAFELSLVASGALDAHVDVRNRIRAVDIAAASLVVQEAGGTVTDLDGRPISGRLDLRSRFTVVAASHAELHREMMLLLGRGG